MKSLSEILKSVQCSKGAVGSLPSTPRKPAQIEMTTPRGNWYVRVKPEAASRVLHEIKSGKDRAFYTVDPDLLSRHGIQLPTYEIFPAVNQSDEPFLWPVKVPLDELDDLHERAQQELERVQQATTRWTKWKWDRNEFRHVPTHSDSKKEPTFPASNIDALVDEYFKSRHIGDEKHPLWPELRDFI